MCTTTELSEAMVVAYELRSKEVHTMNFMLRAKVKDPNPMRYDHRTFKSICSYAVLVLFDKESLWSIRQTLQWALKFSIIKRRKKESSREILQWTSKRNCLYHLRPASMFEQFDVWSSNNPAERIKCCQWKVIRKWKKFDTFVYIIYCSFLDDWLLETVKPRWLVRWLTVTYEVPKWKNLNRYLRPERLEILM